MGQNFSEVKMEALAASSATREDSSSASSGGDMDIAKGSDGAAMESNEETK